VDALSRLRVAGEATATAVVGATSGDDDESEGFKTGEAGSGSLIVASTSPADAQPVDALPASAALGWVTLVARPGPPLTVQSRPPRTRRWPST